MKSKYTELLEVFSQSQNISLLLSGKWGLEKESLRINLDGSLAVTSHPQSLGSSSNHPYITTDFSESQMEIITPPFGTVEEAYHFLEQVQLFAMNNISRELLWSLSMPGKIPDRPEIPIAYYGESPEAKERVIYRRGLSLRYGRKMQLICGMHYNFSFSDELFQVLYDRLGTKKDFKSFKNQVYFSVARNFLRYRWLLVYLFGASPVVDESYKQEVIDSLDLFGDVECGSGSYHKKYAISLRMSKYGYSNTRHTNVRVSYDSLEQYIRDLRKALDTKDERYAKIGVLLDGEQVQLNDHLLQIENEYYAPIRFKQYLKKGETMLQALEKRGINHIEIRALDLDPFTPMGIDLDKLHFLQVFFLFCLFEDDENLDNSERDCANRNQKLVALRGREKWMVLKKCKKNEILLENWGSEIFEKLIAIADLLDNSVGEDKYTQVVHVQEKKLHDVSLLPSSRMVNEMEGKCESYVDFGMRLMRINKNFFKTIGLDEEIQTEIQKYI